MNKYCKAKLRQTDKTDFEAKNVRGTKSLIGSQSIVRSGQDRDIYIFRDVLQSSQTTTAQQRYFSNVV